ncbi:glutamine amidotransferase [Pelagibius sp. 7325]|uniref:glutamine amidotransferase n=1 Tax=Pelagibius sp. 7325 TaxID=3131994 RepID=UPI0030ED6A43
MKSAIAIRHVKFEDLGAFTPALEAAGYAIRYLDIGEADLAGLRSDAADLVVVLGGPISVYEEASYPFLNDEIAFIERRLAFGRPLMGICLGAQLIARAAGAPVYPSGTKEIGIGPVTLTEAGRASCLRPFAAEPDTLHWHGDTFDLPSGATLLASTEICENQAFALGRNVIAFQFHPEADPARIEQWLVGHALELASAGIDVPRLRREALACRDELRRKAEAVAAAWLDGLSEAPAAAAG